MQKVFTGDGADLAISEEAGEAEIAKMFLHQVGVMVGAAEQIPTATVAAAEAAAIDHPVGEAIMGAEEQFVHLLRGASGITPLKLDGLAGAWQGTYGEDAGIRVAAEEIAHEEIAAMKILEVLVDDEADEEIATGFLLVSRRKFLKRLGQHGIGGTVGDLMN